MGLCIFSGILNFKSTIEKASSVFARSFFLFMAEREGFEPSVEFPLHLISNQAPSTTRTPLHIKTKFIIPRNGWSGKGEENYYLMG